MKTYCYLRIGYVVFFLLSKALAVYPQANLQRTGETVKITAGQASLLRSEAQSVRARANATRERLTSRGGVADQLVTVRETLRTSISDANEAVMRVNGLFTRMSTGNAQKQSADIFFGDISARYSRLSGTVGTLEMKSYEPVRDSVFQAFEENALAYVTVAQEGSLTFDLEVDSKPPEGHVSYKRAGDSYAMWPKDTDTTIQNLSYAVWTILVQKPGYEDQQKTHDPYRERNHVLHFDLKKK